MPEDMAQQLSLDGGHEHAHLAIARALDPLPRKIRAGGGGRGPHYADQRKHARNIAAQLANVRDRNKQREPILGINPDLVLVVEFNQPVASVADLLEKADLRVLEARGDKALAAFSSDPEMSTFLSRCQSYGTELTPGGAPRHVGLFDAIDRIRALEPADVIDDDLAERVANSGIDEVLRVDLACWCTSSKEDTERRYNETQIALCNADANIIDKTCRYESGLSLIRADIPAGKVYDVVRTDRVSRASLLPRPLLTLPEVVTWNVEKLPIIFPPARTAPLVAIVDSGIQAGNPLLTQAVFETLSAVDELPDGSDESGHGSFVASLALYGSLEMPLRDRTELRPAGKILGIRVLDRDNAFPDTALWQLALERAIQLAVDQGARVINLSLGDPGHPYRAPAPVGIAAVLDRFARLHDVVLVVSAGNVSPDEHTGQQYAKWLLDAEQTGLAPPAMSALALTVGALVPTDQQGVRPARDSVAIRQLGKAGEPSPVSRTGPGIENAIKPELCASGGTFVYDSDSRRVKVDSAIGQVVGAAGGRHDALLARNVGTSFAAPLVTHAALRVLGRYPNLTAPGVRALVLASGQPVPSVIKGNTPNEGLRAQLNLSGFGRVDADRAEHSTDHRAVMLSEASLQPDQVHFYTVPVPQAFYQNGDKWLTISLAFDPETRATRLNYLASRMSVYVYRGITVDEVRRKFAESEEDASEELDNCKVELAPADRDRLLGANQAATKHWTHGWKQDQHRELVVVVRNSQRWALPGAEQRYALAVVLGVQEVLQPLYAELRSQLAVLAEIEPEIELG